MRVTNLKNGRAATVVIVRHRPGAGRLSLVVSSTSRPTWRSDAVRSRRPGADARSGRQVSGVEAVICRLKSAPH